MAIVFLVGLYLGALALLCALERFAAWRDKRRFAKAMALYDRIAAETVIVKDMDPVERSEYLRAIREHARPRFGVCPTLLDGSERIGRSFGAN
jgi:hypothetical protein